MPTPSERLEKLIKAYTPSEIVFRANQTRPNSILLEGVVVKKAEVKEVSEDKELQELLNGTIVEYWDPETGTYSTHTDVNAIWYTIKSNIVGKYLYVSQRCEATKRKTEQFIQDIKIDEKFLSNYLLQTFIKIMSPSYSDLTRPEREMLFEQFETLRRTYGKRK